MKTKEKYHPTVLVNPAFNPGIENIDVLYDRHVLVCIKDLPPQELPSSTFNIYVDCTEPSVWCDPLKNVQERQDLDLILTKRPELIETAPCKSVLFPFGTCWTKNTKEKEFGVSFVITSPTDMDGYEIRHRLWKMKDEITIPKYFYNSSKRPIVDAAPKLGDTKEDLFNTMFSVCIENTKEPYYFSEKLIDCIQSKTVPIYYGCSRIEEFFDIDGMILVSDEKEIIEICNSLTSEDYENRKDSILNNYEKSKEYATDFPQRLFDTIEKCLEQN